MSSDPSPNTNVVKQGISPATLLMIVTIQMEGGAIVLALLIAYFCNISLLETINFAPLNFLEGTIATIPLLVVFWLLYRIRMRSVDFIRRFLAMLNNDYLRHCSTFQLAIIALLAGVGEELLFRGVAQMGIAYWVGGANGLVIGVLVSAVLFGIMHPVSMLYVLLCFVTGIYMSLLFIWTDNLLVPIIVHTLYDFCVLLWLPKVIGIKQEPHSIIF